MGLCLPQAGSSSAPRGSGDTAMPELLILTTAAIDGAGHLVTAVGEIDTATAAALAEYLVQFDDGSNVTVDFSGVTFLDASGMHALHAAHARLGRQGSTLSIRGTPPLLLRLFQIAGFDQVLNLDADV